MGVTPFRRGRAFTTRSLLRRGAQTDRSIANAKKPMNSLINTSKAIAILSFLIGTILFATQLYFITSYRLIYFGIIFIMVTAIINTISILTLIFSMLGYTSQRLELLKTCGIVLVNIPIAILYFYILIKSI